MKKEDVVSKICRIAEEFQRVKTKSFIQLAEDANFTEYQKSRGIEDIKKYLTKNSRLIESWLEYSMNKRTDQGWYLYEDMGSSAYIVGYLSKNSGKKKESKYADAVQACSYFIYNELIEALKK